MNRRRFAALISVAATLALTGAAQASDATPPVLPVQAQAATATVNPYAYWGT